MIRTIALVSQRAAPQSRRLHHLFDRRPSPAACHASRRAICSSTHSSQQPSHPGTEALPFRVAPEAAVEHLRVWQRLVLPRAHLNGRMGHTRILSIQAFYFPFWAFAANLTACSSAAAAAQPVGCAADVPIPVPVLLVYSGSSLPRPMTEVIKNDVDVGAAGPFRESMLDIGMKVQTRG
jgi:hypothetical protein